MSENEQPQKPKINVEIDTKRTEELSRNLALAERDRDEYKAKLEQIAHKAIEQKLDALSILDEEKRKNYHAHPDLLAQDYPSKAGSAPLNSQQMGQGDRMKFSSNEEMISYCRAHKDEIVSEKDGFTGEDVLRILFGYTVKNLKNGVEWQGYNPDANVQLKSGNPEVALHEGMHNDPSSQLQQFLGRGRERYREQIALEREHAYELTRKKLEQKKVEIP
jgi:hypothetical protein